MTRPRSAAETEALAALCRAVFVGPMADAADVIAFAPAPGTIPATRLADPDVFEARIDRFRRVHPTTDRQAAISFWSQWYFGRLLPPAAILCLAAPAGLPIDFGDLHLAFDPDTGVPTRFHAPTGDERGSGATNFAGLLDRHVGPMIAILRRHSGLSARLFWENAGWYLVWALGGIARRDPRCADAARALLADGTWPRGACAGVAHLKSATLAGQTPLRRICCLRYAIPGTGRCQGVCPLREDDGSTSVPRSAH